MEELINDKLDGRLCQPNGLEVRTTTQNTYANAARDSKLGRSMTNNLCSIMEAAKLVIITY